MKWRGGRESSNIEDRRSQGSGGFGMPSGRRTTSSVGVGGGLGLVAIVVVGWFFGVDLTPLLDGSGGSTSTGGASRPLTPEDEDLRQFVAVSLGYTEDVWKEEFQKQLGRSYTPVTLVLFSGVTDSACGTADSATGPFYCPDDKEVYLDTDFFATLQQELGADGDFAMAYVIAHEVGHHVQDEMGVLSQANRARSGVSEERSNEISVRIELQADCLAGIWGRYVESDLGAIDEGDFEEAINAAKKIGDDTLQRNAGQVPMPDSFTHGTSAQRAKWFQIGLKTGEIAACDTFKVANP